MFPYRVHFVFSPPKHRLRSELRVLALEVNQAPGFQRLKRCSMIQSALVCLEKQSFQSHAGFQRRFRVAVPAGTPGTS